MDEQKQKLIERIRQAQNILVTVSANPTVDQLSATIGLTLALNKLDKHGTAVFSGEVPSTIEFLKPEETLEKNTDSLRDFIIALDKSKADKLRYKVEDQVVRIFITPYKTSLSENDLEFSQGDFNVDVVVCLGVTEQQDLDAAITAHGRILHDATVVSISSTGQGSLGTINWVDPSASSLSEMIVGLVDGLDKKAMDNQIATALLTGIVASTERFRNEKTTPKTMSASAALMTAGADQRLIASELEAPVAPPEQPVEQYTPPADGEDGEAPKRDPGTLEISHTGDSDTFEAPEESEPEPKQPQVQVSEDGQLLFEPEGPLPQISSVRGVPTDGLPTESAGKTEVKRERLVEPPRMGGADLTANLTPEDLDPSTEELTLPPINSPLLSHNETVLQPSSELPAPPKPENSFIPQQPLQPAPPAWQPPEPPATPPKPEPKFEPVAPAPVTPPLPTPAPAPLPEPPALVAPPAPAPLPPAPGRPMPPAPPAPAPGATLSDIEKSVSSPHVHIGDDGTFSNNLTPPPAAVDDARSAVQAALNSPAAPIGPLPPVTSLNAQPLGPDLHAAPVAPAAPAVPNLGFSEPTPGNTPADSTLDMPLPSNPFGPGQQATPPAPAAPSAFPGTPPPTTGGAALPPPPVPPPFTPPQV